MYRKQLIHKLLITAKYNMPTYSS